MRERVGGKDWIGRTLCFDHPDLETLRQQRSWVCVWEAVVRMGNIKSGLGAKPKVLLVKRFNAPSHQEERGVLLS